MIKKGNQVEILSGKDKGKKGEVIEILRNKNKAKLNQINEKRDKLTPLNFFKKNLNKKNIEFHNYFVEKIKNHKATMNGMNLMCSKLFLSKPKGIFSGRTNTYKEINIIGTQPIYPKAKPRPEVLPILFSLEHFFSNEL